MATTRLGGGIHVKTFPTPPPDFDPDRASNRERILYGYPRCAVEFPELAERWKRKLKAKPFRFIQPEFKPRPLRRRALPHFLGKHGPQSTPNWAGVYVVPPSGDSFKWVEANWRFPQSYLPGDANGSFWYSASTWIGIDGDNGSGDILQAGCDSDVSGSGNQYNPWWEWYPAGSFWITNLSFAPGDEISLLICVTLGTTNSAAVFLSNLTQSTGGLFQATAPAGTNIVGNSAEWIVEALDDGNGFLLANFDPVAFMGCNAGTMGGVTVESGSGQLIDMTNGPESIIADPSLVGSNQVDITYTGP